MKNSYGIFNLGLALVLFGAVTAAFADQRAEMTTGTTTVTAQKVEENSRDVPISLTLFDAYSMEDKQIESVKDIAPYTPNLMLFDNSGGGNFSPTMRGIKTRGDSLSTSVGMFIDGIPILNSNGFDEVLMDIKRIEVLKGPQGTLYGKDTQAGAINIITRKPDNEARRKIKADLGTDNKRAILLNVSGPLLKDRFYFGIAGKHYEKDGFIENTKQGGHTDDREHNFGKLNLRFTPSDNLDISFISSKLKRDDGDNAVNGVQGENRKISTDIMGYDESESTSHALKISYDFNNYRFESITTQRTFESITLGNYHFPPTSDFHLESNNTYERASQEFRVTGAANRLTWLAGLYADKDDNEYEFVQFSSSETYPTYQTIEGDSFGVFLHGDYALSQRFSVLAGIRYDQDNKTFEDRGMNLYLEKSCNEITPKLQVKFRKNAHHMFYATVSKGYRSGGFHPYAAAGYSKDYDTETLWNYELGSKSTFFNGKLMLNAAVFYMDINDMQTKTSPEPGKSYMANAAKATSKGFELEANANISKSWGLFASFGYSDAAFDEYSDADGNYQGNKNPYAPEYNYNIGAQYRSGNGFFSRVDINGYGKTYFDKENKNSRDAYNLVNLKIGYEAENYDVYCYAKNLFDTEYDSVGAHGGYFTIYSPPREIGVQLAYRF